MCNAFLENQFVAFHLTHHCNLACPYCYAGAKSRGRMDDETAESAIRFALAEARDRGVGRLDVIFFGGEPLLELDLLCRICDRFAEAASGVEVSFSLSTNGVLLTPEVIERLAGRRIYVSLSLDGPPEVHDRQRPFPGGRGSSAALAEAAPRLLRWNPCAEARCVITPSSANVADRSVRWIAGMGFAYISTALDYSADWNRESLGEFEASLRRLADWYCARTEAGDPLYVSCFDERIRTRTDEPLRGCDRCGVGLRQYSIAPSGRLYPCVQFVGEDAPGEFVIGDIRNGFDEAARVSVYNRALAAKPECAGCAVADRCASWCACTNFAATGGIDRVGPLVCEVERIVLPIADDIGNRLWRRRARTFVHKFYNPAFPVFNWAENTIMEEVDHESTDEPRR